jgi:predicted methyltransferase
VIERYTGVVELFRSRHQALPASFEIVVADWFDFVETVPPESVDGILFDPALPASMWDDVELWDRAVPAMRRALRKGGALVPFFTTRPYLRWQYLRAFDRILVERHPFRAYPGTGYTAATEGDAFIQCFIRTG